MHRLHLTAVAVVLLLFGTLAGTARAHGTPPGDPATVPERIVFPVVGYSWFQDDFGAARAQGGHEANDVIGRWAAPVAAAENGRIRISTSSASAGCMLYLYGESGTTYLYVHLNDDLTKRDDNEGGCASGVAFAPGLENGQTVRAGELIGYVGNSGNARGGVNHVHFELHPEDKGAVSPYRWLKRAQRLLFTAPTKLPAEGPPLTLRLHGTVLAGDEGEPPDQLKVRIQKVRLSIGGAFQVAKTVILAIPVETVIERSAKRTRKPADLEDAAGQRVVVWTNETELTLEAQRGAPGVLSAARILLRGPA